MIINVAFITDTNYVLATAAACNSIIKSKRQETVVKIHVLAVNLSETTKRLISEVRGENAEVIVIEAHNDLQHLAQAHPHVSPAALLKFHLPRLFHELDRILYLDGDIICLSDLSDLYRASLGDRYAAVVKDMAAMVDENHHNKIGHSAYFNSGMMLLNLLKMREDEVSEQLIELKSKRTYSHFMDQDEFNAILGENVVLLPPSHNLMERNFRHSLDETAQFYGIGCSGLQDMLASPLLKHLTNSPKVWCNPRDDDFELWFRYLPAPLIKHYIWFLNDLLSQRAGEAEARATHMASTLIGAESLAKQADARSRQAEGKAQQAREQAMHAEAKALQAHEQAMHAEAKALQAHEQAMHAEAKALQAHEQAMHAEAKALQAEAASTHHMSQLQAVYGSRSWRLTAPLRWASKQIKCLRKDGFRSRIGAFASKALRRLNQELLIRPTLRQRMLNWSRKLGVHGWLKKMIVKSQGYPKSFSALAQETMNRSTLPENLPPRARQVYTDLTQAIEYHQKENS